MEKAKTRIEKELERVRKTLDPKAKSRWKHGYADGLATALRMMGEEKEGNR